MDGYKGGIGILIPTGISIELGRDKEVKTRAQLFDDILSHVQNINDKAYKATRTNAVFFSKGGKKEKVLIRTISSGYTGYSLNNGWDGYALFFERSDKGEVKEVNIAGERYKVVLTSPEEYKKIVDSSNNGKYSGTPDKDNIGKVLGEEEFKAFFGKED